MMNFEPESNGTILVVDDLPATISLVRTALEERGYDVLVAISGAEALQRAALTTPDLILLDILMPGLDGYDTCQQLKAQAATRQIPVIFMTMVTETVDKVKGFQLGAVDYLTKPIEAEELLARVKTHLTIARLHQELQAANAGLEQQVAARTAELRAANTQLQRELAEHQQAEDKLHLSERRLNEAQRIAHIGSWELDLFTNRLEWSDEIYRIFEINPNQFGASYEAFLDLIHPEDRDMVNCAYTASVNNRTPYDIIHRLKFSDRRIKFVHEHGETFYNEAGKPGRSFGTVQDVTERKRAEEEIRRLNQELEQRVIQRTAQLEAANKELEAFAYSVSHDLRAPLRHITMFLGMLRERLAALLDDQSQHYLDTISDSARRMGALIDDLLSFSRMGRSGMTTRPVDLARLVREVIQELTPDTAGRQIHWQIADLPVVTGDRAMLRIALVNLLANAVKFTRSRAPAAIAIGCQPGQGAETVIFVRDNGVGFDMQYADKLFGVFQRLHRADEFEGTGIGLANVRRIVARHGGKTWAEGQVNQGATFYFSLQQSI